MIEGILADIVIKRLDKEGINLQETILNLKNQGYKDYWNAWLKYLLKQAMDKRVMEIMWKNTRGGEDD